MAARALPGSLAVSMNSSLIFLPRMPPEALISSTAMLEPFFHMAPTVAPPPESSMMLGMTISWAKPAGAHRPPMARPANASVLRSMFPPFLVLRYCSPAD